jgi:diguanylate cyclase (GGDEF)-like protein
VVERVGSGVGGDPARVDTLPRRRRGPFRFVARRLPHRVAVAITSYLIVVAGLAMAAAVIWSETHVARPPVDGAVFAMMSLFLVLGEVVPRCWIRTGMARPVTPLWLFTFGLLLLGSPAAAMGMALAAATLHGLVQRDPLGAIVLRLAGVAMSLGTAAMLLVSSGSSGTVREVGTVSWRWVIEAGVAGVVIVLSNTFVTAVDEAARSRTPLTTTLRRGVGARITAEGALLSLAPIWVVGIDFSLALLPLLGMTTILVFRSTRQALERAYEARHDALTGLANRRAFREQVTDAFAGNIGATRTGVVLLMDLDGFKEINDQLGHELGDSLLVAFAERLRSSLASTAVAARLGGDEFAVLLPLDRGTTDDLVTSVTSLHAALVRPLEITAFPVTVGVSIGIAVAPQHGRSASELLRAADVAMYRAKRRGTSVEHYDDCVQSPKRGRLALLGELGRALSDHEFQVHFQPQLRMDTGHVDTLEALIRWQHPEHGLIPPADFIGLAEQTDLIGPITETVLKMSTYGLLLAGVNDVRLAVNVSARSLQDRHFASLLFSALAETGFPPHRLEIEVTERALISHPERSSYSIERLREAGVSIAIDDFGTGYSSFETLRQLDVDRVKIDGVFVRGALHHGRDRVIVETVVDLAHRLGLEVVAEGVESTEIWEVIRGLRCDVAQGYGIARPMPFPELRGWLTRWNELGIGHPDLPAVDVARLRR